VLAIISTIFFYTFSVSSVLVYGAGLGQFFSGSGKKDALLIHWAKLLVVSMGASLLLWPLTQMFLAPYGMEELYPFFCVFIVIGVEKAVEALFGLFRESSSSWTVVTVPCVIFTVNESITFGDVISISAGSCISFFITSLFLMAIKKRLEFKDSAQDMRNGPLLLISIGFLALIFFAWNVSWWQYGGVRW
jgi:Na+-translocating ferredoxin:NAD+ oxidoreductase RnfA subunit